MSGRADGRPGTLRDADALVFVEDLANPALAEEDAHHLLDVARLRIGASVAVADGQGSWRLTRLESVGHDGAPNSERGRPARDAARARLGAVGPVLGGPQEAPVAVGFALPKGERADWAVQKLTELGVDRIIPLLAERSVVRLDADDARRRGERFRRIAREAAMQCRRADLPEVEDPAPLTAVLASCGAAGLAEPGGGRLGAATIALLVGPEGGWSPRELALGLPTVDLGPTVLRVETAAVAAGALLAMRRSGVVPSI